MGRLSPGEMAAGGWDDRLHLGLEAYLTLIRTIDGTRKSISPLMPHRRT
jgi:hypothetical protein